MDIPAPAPVVINIPASPKETRPPVAKKTRFEKELDPNEDGVALIRKILGEIVDNCGTDEKPDEYISDIETNYQCGECGLVFEIM